MVSKFQPIFNHETIKRIQKPCISPPGRQPVPAWPAARAMAAVVPTAAEVRKQPFGRPKIVEALQLLCSCLA